jgi:hypothetical protein
MSKFDQKQHDEQKRQNSQKRLNDLHARDWSLVPTKDIYDGLSAVEQKSLHVGCPSFQEAESAYETISGFRRLTADQQSEFFSQANEKTRSLLEQDGYVSSQTTTLAKSPGEHEDESEARRAEQQNQIFTESADAQESVAFDDKHGLYPGVEYDARSQKYRLTVDAGDGASPEIFIGDSQKECFIKLTESKKHATRALRRRASQVQITQALREMDIDVIEYPPLEVKVTLSPAEIFDATEKMKDPTTAVEAARLLAAAGRTQAEVDLANENTIRGRYLEQKEAAERWLTDNPQFYPCPENLKALMDITGTLNWAITKKNLDIAFAELVRQNALVERLPETEPEFRTGPAPKERPAPFIPPSAQTPAAPRVPATPAVRPASRKVLNNSSLGGGETSFVRRNTTPVKPSPMTASEYAGLTSAELKTRFNRDEAFRARVEAYWAGGGR